MLSVGRIAGTRTVAHLSLARGCSKQALKTATCRRQVVGMEHHRVLVGARFQSTKSSPPSSSSSSSGANKSQSTNTAAAPPVPAEEAKKTIWEKVKHEAQHYWDGTKLLGYELKVSTKLAAKMFAGHRLTRRENRQLKRTLIDMARLVPFSMFVLIPFAELLLPVALKIFPNLLPSTYESGKERESKSKKLRTVRGDVSSFLRQTVSEKGMSLPLNVTPEQREQFNTFFKQVKTVGEKPSRELLIAVARLFKDDTVLDNLSRPQLVAMAKYMNLQPYGTNLMLRYSIRHKMKQIKRDDRAIDREGVDSLTVPELQYACASRGIQTHGMSPGHLRDDLSNWLELRLHQKVPSTLLVMSSAYTYGQAENLDTHYESIQAVLCALPEELYHEAELEVSSDAATNKQRLEVLKEQEELIEDENKEEQDSGHVIKVNDDISLEEEEEAKELASGNKEQQQIGEKKGSEEQNKSSEAQEKGSEEQQKSPEQSSSTDQKK